jgi:hypothetical protein
VGLVFSDNLRSLIVETVETNDNGGLHISSELIGGVRPHTKFDLEILGDVLVLRPADKGRPFWQQATSQQRADAFRRWVESPRPPAPDLTDESLRRENLYD